MGLGVRFVCSIHHKGSNGFVAESLYWDTLWLGHYGGCVIYSELTRTESPLL